MLLSAKSLTRAPLAGLHRIRPCVPHPASTATAPGRGGLLVAHFRPKNRSTSRSPPPHEVHHMTQEEKEEIAHREFGKSYSDLDVHEKKTMGGIYRRERMAAEKGGDIHAAYSDMSKKQVHKDAERDDKGEK